MYVSSQFRKNGAQSAIHWTSSSLQLKLSGSSQSQSEMNSIQVVLRLRPWPSQITLNRKSIQSVNPQYFVVHQPPGFLSTTPWRPSPCQRRWVASKVDKRFTSQRQQKHGDEAQQKHSWKIPWTVHQFCWGTCWWVFTTKSGCKVAAIHAPEKQPAAKTSQKARPSANSNTPLQFSVKQIVQRRATQREETESVWIL